MRSASQVRDGGGLEIATLIVMISPMGPGCPRWSLHVRLPVGCRAVRWGGLFYVPAEVAGGLMPG